ncbi:MAG: Nudix family hydrolase [Gammaproteobacteria bacterium]|nr:Nudix family hydrolase [Gammaproteobacteria bacterium]
MTEADTRTKLSPPGEPIHVAAAALVDSDGRVLLARRHDDSHQGGLWEFPGGKLEAGESLAEGLRRELHEELGIEVVSHRPLIRITHHYDDRSVLLDVHRVERWQGDPHGREGQPLAWVAPASLGEYPMPAADEPIVKALRLPGIYVITPPDIVDEQRFLAQLDGALAGGMQLLQLRLFDLPAERFEALGREVCRRCGDAGARVLLNGSAEFSDRIGADGVHLSSRALRSTTARPLPTDRLVAASCHTQAELTRAAEIGADFALLSPVLPTRSHPDAEPLGWTRFAEWVEPATLPVFALGGMRADLQAVAWSHGGQGIAGIRGLWPGDSQ